MATRAMHEENRRYVFRISGSCGEGWKGEWQKKQEPHDTDENITTLLGFLLAGVRCWRGIGSRIANEASPIGDHFFRFLGFFDIRIQFDQ